MVDKDRIRELRAAGWTYQRIADELGCSRAWVEYVVKDRKPKREVLKRVDQVHRQKRLMAAIEKRWLEGLPPADFHMRRWEREAALDPEWGKRTSGWDLR